MTDSKSPDEVVTPEEITWMVARDLTKKAYAKMVICLMMEGDPTKQEGYETIETLFDLNDGKAMRPDIQEAFIILADRKMNE